MPQPPARTFASPSLDTNPHRRSRSSLKLSPRATSLFPPTSNERICPVAPRAIPLLAPQTNSLLYSTPRSSEAASLHVAGRRIQALGLDPRPLVEIALQSLGADRSIGQSMRGQDREGPTARTAQIALDTLYLLLFLGVCWISVAFVSSMKMHHPPTTTGTLRTQSIELIFAKLDGGDFPKSSPAIKSLYFGPENLD